MLFPARPLRDSSQVQNDAFASGCPHAKDNTLPSLFCSICKHLRTEFIHFMAMCGGSSSRRISWELKDSRSAGHRRIRCELGEQNSSLIL